MSDYWPGRRVIVTKGTFAGQEGWIAGPDARRDFHCPEPEEGQYFVIVSFRGGERAIRLSSEEMELARQN